MTRYRVFLGAPSLQQREDNTSYSWQSVSSLPSEQSVSKSVVFPTSTLDAASRRISLIYQNVIFDDDAEDEGDSERVPGDDEQNDHAEDSFLDDNSIVSRAQETFETMDSVSYNYSDASSIARFPDFHFNLHSLTSLSSLNSTSREHPESRKVALVLAVLEVDGPDSIRIKKGVDAGKYVSIMKIILGDEEGQICKLTAWREVAEAWGGIAGDLTAVKRGDVVFIDNVLASCNSSTPSPATLTASPYLKSTIEICYRVMPYTHEDNYLRPDLRLGASDAVVRKVATVVAWFEKMAGLAV